MRRLLGGALLLLAACEVREEQSAQPAAASGGGDAIACALDGATSFAPVCAVERAPEGETLFLVVRHPDGGFRRFEVLRDGRGLAMADGADAVRLTIAGEFLEAEVADDRYLFPATIGSGGGK